MKLRETVDVQSEQTVSVLFEQGAAKKNIFASQIKTAFFGALPVDFWMLSFAEIQHRVASLTLEYKTTFTRHHAFLKRLDPNFHPVKVVRLGDSDQNFHQSIPASLPFVHNLYLDKAL